MSRRRWITLLTAGLLASAQAAQAGDEALIRLLEKRSCPRCDLADADLVHADLRDANLQGSKLQRANLSQARLDGARLNGADLSFTSLLGASLRGTDLRGARLEATDLRQADLSGALLDPGALSRTHWQQAKGLPIHQMSYTELHNAGVEETQAGRFADAERFFSAAIRRQPDSAISWAARAISRNEQGKEQMASADLSHAASLYRARGENKEAELLEAAAKQLTNPHKKTSRGSNGSGSKLLAGLMATLKLLTPLATMAIGGVGI